MDAGVPGCLIAGQTVPAERQRGAWGLAPVYGLDTEWQLGNQRGGIEVDRDPAARGIGGREGGIGKTRKGLASRAVPRGSSPGSGGAAVARRLWGRPRARLPLSQGKMVGATGFEPMTSAV